jgi:hypothetical protein
MHALRLLPPHLWRVTLTAALLTIVVMGLLFAGANGLSSGSRDAGRSATPASPAKIITEPGNAPRWVTSPLSPPAFHLVTNSRR